MTTQEATESDERGHESDLTHGQEAALAALLTSATIEAAAKKANVSDRTLHRWLNEAAFRRAYLAARRQSLEQATGALQRAVTDAAAALVRNLTCGTPGVEVRAAQIILEQTAKGVEMLEFEERLAAVEQGLGTAQA